MKKLNKDQIQKLILSGILLAALLYCYFQFGLKPLKARDKANAAAIAEAQTKVEAAKLQIRKGQNAEKNAVESIVKMTAINKMIPTEAPVAWLPPLLTDFFNRQGIPNVSIKPIRKETVTHEGLTDYRYYFWTVDAPKVPFVKMAATLAALENSQPLMAIRSVQLDADVNDPEQQRFSCELKAILK